MKLHLKISHHDERKNKYLKCLLGITELCSKHFEADIVFIKFTNS